LEEVDCLFEFVLGEGGREEQFVSVDVYGLAVGSVVLFAEDAHVFGFEDVDFGHFAGQVIGESLQGEYFLGDVSVVAEGGLFDFELVFQLQFLGEVLEDVVELFVLGAFLDNNTLARIELRQQIERFEVIGNLFRRKVTEKNPGISVAE
jgi:hypothetical protein